MILAKVNTEVFGKTVPDDTPKKHLGDYFWLIRDRVYAHYEGCSEATMILDGQEKAKVTTEWYALCSKKLLKESGQDCLIPYANYNTNSVKVSDL